MNHPQRLHSLDGLRAVMMWLGIVLHVSVLHVVYESPIPWRDRETTLIADFLLFFIHCFRMPVFFILAGFFVAMLIKRHGYSGMLKHRVRRIGLPFIVFWPIVYVGVIACIVLYVNAVVKGVVGFDLTVMPEPKASDPPIINPLHMWFIYYLLLFCWMAFLFSWVEKHISNEIKNGLSRIWFALGKNWWGFIVLAIPLALVSPFNRDAIMDTSDVSFIPQFSLLLHNGMFFIFGLYLYGFQETLLNIYVKNCLRYFLWGMLFFVFALMLLDLSYLNLVNVHLVKFCVALTYSFSTWLFSFSMIGFFIKYLSGSNRFLSYLAESSYWVYLMHLMATIGFGALLYNTSFSAVSKMGLNIFATTLVCLLTYHFFVRNTYIGVLLNGRRFPLGFEKAPDERAAESRQMHPGE